jgi:hypothetical protein
LLNTRTSVQIDDLLPIAAQNISIWGFFGKIAHELSFSAMSCPPGTMTCLSSIALAKMERFQP